MFPYIKKLNSENGIKHVNLREMEELFPRTLSEYCTSNEKEMSISYTQSDAGKL